ncbi:hypothetical protein [Pseudoduganella sp. RAF53_2]|uniref:hypothetical protein n=1 Tax=unclassified Pseudoduganella TaxID=2637179 RepID=UPI003F97429F
MNTATHNVVPLRQAHVAIQGANGPKVWSAEAIQALSVLNRAVRWLREQDVPVQSVDVTGTRPTIAVHANAGPVLTAAAHGKSTRRLPDGGSLCSVIVHDCLIQWQPHE